MAPITVGKEAVLQRESVLPLLHTNVEGNSKRTKAVSTRTHTHTEVIWPHACTHKHINLKEMTQQKKKASTALFYTQTAWTTVTTSHLRIWTMTQ